MFSQTHYKNYDNLFRKDAFLLGLTRRLLPQETYLLAAPQLENLGDAIVSQLMELGNRADKNPPFLENCDVFGHRIDKLHLSHEWQRIKKFAQQNRLVGIGYDKRFRHGRRIVQSAMQLMFSAYSSNLSCPLAMTDGAIKVLNEYAPKSLKEQVLQELLGKEESAAFCGQWMTERSGGSDLKKIETHATLARKESDQEIYRLYGLKWFCSAIDNEYALVLAQIPNEGPSLFLLKVWQNEQLMEGIKIERLKNKLGTKALPTAEVRLEGATATLIGIKGRGIFCASGILNITRYYNALASASIINRAFFSCLAYAKIRHSFGKAIIDHPFHLKTLAHIDAQRTGAVALCFEIARLLGSIEEGTSSEKDGPLLRVLIPIAKIILAKWAIYATSEAMEAVGGIGYLEDTEFPQLLRDAQVLPIWEGTTNILIHDLLRAQRKEGALTILLKELCERANNLMIDETDACRILKSRLQLISEKVMNAIHKSEDDSSLYLESFARKAVFTIGTCTAALLLAESKPFITQADSFASTRFTTFVENNLCGHFSM
ncbi:MAG: acyl-CoA dehydrogenase family protein [Myxococcales bacterium]|nr:acyl-CoA dehydrogenase family protein [Myxococcales bacterium]USN50166.1 MAG: acyl-CoA dehydrogenase family protein [Myxococcales bacterium]